MNQTSRGKIGVGDRVLITDTKHPWYGHTGILTDELIKLTDQLVVELDNGQRAGVYLRQVKPL